MNVVYHQRSNFSAISWREHSRRACLLLLHGSGQCLMTDERKVFHLILLQWRGKHYKFDTVVTSVKIIHILKWFCFVDIRSRPTAKKWRRSVWSYCQKGRTFLCVWRRPNGVWRHRNTMQNHTRQRKNVCYRGTDVYVKTKGIFHILQNRIISNTYVYITMVAKGIFYILQNRIIKHVCIYHHGN